MDGHRNFSVLLFAALAALSGHAQTAGKYLAPRDQLIAIRAGRLFDARSTDQLNNSLQSRIEALTYAVHQGTIGLLRLTPVFSPTINSPAWLACWQTYSNSS
jgi:hypothetical protein